MQTWGVEGLWAQRVSERQTNWPFSTLHWQLVIRGNYKGLLATNHLILLWEWEPNVITALWYADPAPSGTKPRSQREGSKSSNFGQMTKVFSFGQKEWTTCFLQLLNSPNIELISPLLNMSTCDKDGTLCWSKSRSSGIILCTVIKCLWFFCLYCHFHRDLMLGAFHAATSSGPSHTSVYREMFRTKPIHFKVQL